MAEALRLLLTDEINIRERGTLFHALIERRLRGIRGELGLKLEGMIEMILNGDLASVCNDKNIFNTRSCRLFYDILNSGLVNYIQHFLRD